MKLTKYTFLVIPCVFVCLLWGISRVGYAQERNEILERDYQNERVEMADRFRAEGKIYVVVAVILTIFVGITGYLILTERKIHLLQQKVEELKQLQPIVKKP
ncbi:MAG: CcmD family protein [Bernardetiaceae bacterium]